MIRRKSDLSLPVLTLFLSLLLFPLQAQVTNQYEISFAEATEHFQNQDFDAARLSLQRAIRESDSFAPSDTRGPLAISFLAIIEMNRGRVDRSEELHADALSMMALMEDQTSDDIQLIRTRQGEFYISQKKWNKAIGVLEEIESIESKKENPNLLIAARTQWGQAQSHFASKSWKDAGRSAYFARQTLQRLYGEKSMEQARAFPIIVESAIRLGQYSNARLWLEEYGALLDPETTPPSTMAQLRRLQIMYSEAAREETVENLQSARQRVTRLLSLAVYELGPEDPGYVLTVKEEDDLQSEFNYTEREAIGGKKVKYGLNETSDVAFAMTESNRIISKAVIAISMNSPIHRDGVLHPSLLRFTEMFFDPNHESVIEWIEEKAFTDPSSLDYANRFNNQDRQIRFSIDSDNELYIFEFFSKEPEA